MEDKSVKREVPRAEKIPYDDFAKVEIKVGQILLAERVPETDKLLKLSVDFGAKTEVVLPTQVQEPGAIDAKLEPKPQRDTRQIISGISLYFPDPLVLVGKKCLFVTNLEARRIKGLESDGMILALSGPEGAFSLLEPNDTIPVGARVK